MHITDLIKDFVAGIIDFNYNSLSTLLGLIGIVVIGKIIYSYSSFNKTDLYIKNLKQPQKKSSELTTIKEK